MLDNRKKRMTVFLIAAVLLFAAVFAAAMADRAYGKLSVLHIVEEAPELGKQVQRDYHRSLYYRDKPVQADLKTSTIYISCRADSKATVTQAVSELTCLLPDSTAYFVRSTDDLSEAIRQGTEFELLISEDHGCYAAYRVIFTGCPVLSVVQTPGDTGSLWDENGEDETLTGEFLLTAPYDPETGEGRSWESYAAWHLRGGSSRKLDKKPWKLNLKKMTGHPIKMDLLDMPADKGWALNPMNKEDTKVREQIFMKLWNELAEQTPYNSRMSSAEYVELVLDGQYMGLYLLQRMVDADYLGLPRDSILMKGSSDQSLYLKNCYEIRQSPLDEDSTYELMRPIWEKTDVSSISVESLIDTNLMLQFAASPDNSINLNAYFIFRPQGDGYRMEYLPWDTDMSFGLSWGEDNYFALDPEENVSMTVERSETEEVRKLCPDFDERTARRYWELRASVLNEEHVLDCVDSLEDQLVKSGALRRDVSRWGTIYGGEDSIENLRQFISDRIAWLDDFYTQEF